MNQKNKNQFHLLLKVIVTADYLYVLYTYVRNVILIVCV